jgi:hypothetical protein
MDPIIQATIPFLPQCNKIYFSPARVTNQTTPVHLLKKQFRACRRQTRSKKQLTLAPTGPHIHHKALFNKRHAPTRRRELFILPLHPLWALNSKPINTRHTTLLSHVLAMYACSLFSAQPKQYNNKTGVNPPERDKVIARAFVINFSRTVDRAE